MLQAWPRRLGPLGWRARPVWLGSQVQRLFLSGDVSVKLGTYQFDAARAAGLNADPADDLADAMDLVTARAQLDGDAAAPRILICGSLYLAGRVLAQNG